MAKKLFEYALTLICIVVIAIMFWISTGLLHGGG